MVRQAHHERKYENPFALSLSKGDLAKQGTFGAKLLYKAEGRAKDYLTHLRVSREGNVDSLVKSLCRSN